MDKKALKRRSAGPGPGKTRLVQWHSGFAAALDLELEANRENFIYEKEYNLNTKPLEIDLLVIKKNKDVQIANEIGKIFRKFNILEYKSPDDHLNVDTFFKAGAYACLYKSYGKTVDERKAEDITVSLVRERHPKGLFKYFKRHHIRTENPYRGVYYVLDGVLFPTQIIVIGELEGPSHIWLRSLSGRLKKEEMVDLIERTETLTGQFERRLADAVLEVSVRANQAIAEELKGDERMCQALLELMKPEINLIMDKVAKETADKVAKETADRVAKETADRVAKETADRVARETADGEARKTAINMLKSGKFAPEEIQQYIPRLSVEEIKALAT